jgi:hypothetical protein
MLLHFVHDNTGWSKSLYAPDDFNTNIYKLCSNCPPASLQTFIDRAREGGGDTRIILTPSVIPNSNYVIMVGDWDCLKYCIFACFFCAVIVRWIDSFWSFCRNANSVMYIVPSLQWFCYRTDFYFEISWIAKYVSHWLAFGPPCPCDVWWCLF